MDLWGGIILNFYISDLHVFCKSQTKQGANYDNRPFETVEEMNQYMLQRWNTRVTNADKVYAAYPRFTTGNLR